MIVKCATCPEYFEKHNATHKFCKGCAKERAKIGDTKPNSQEKITWTFRPDTVHRSTVYRRNKKLKQTYE